MTYKGKLKKLVGKRVRYGSLESGGPANGKLLEVGEDYVVLHDPEVDVIIPLHALVWVELHPTQG